jgi:hypothetical protein
MVILLNFWRLSVDHCDLETSGDGSLRGSHIFMVFTSEKDTLMALAEGVEE